MGRQNLNKCFCMCRFWIDKWIMILLFIIVAWLFLRRYDKHVFNPEKLLKTDQRKYTLVNLRIYVVAYRRIGVGLLTHGTWMTHSPLYHPRSVSYPALVTDYISLEWYGAMYISWASCALPHIMTPSTLPQGGISGPVLRGSHEYSHSCSDFTVAALIFCKEDSIPQQPLADLLDTQVKFLINTKCELECICILMISRILI